jgi:putrescine transport system ATP-binding protein
LKELQRKLRTTFVIVTHDQDEAMTLADRIAVMNAGKLVQVADPVEIYERPNSRWVADFIGDVSLIEARANPDGMLEGAAGKFTAVNSDAAQGTTVWLALRPEKIGLSRERPAGAANAVSGTIAEIGYRGDRSIYNVRIAGGSTMRAALPNTGPRLDLSTGDRVWLFWGPHAAAVLTR